jgi:hypothetical protein
VHANEAGAGAAAAGAEGEGMGGAGLDCQRPAHARAGDLGKKSPDRWGHVEMRWLTGGVVVKRVTWVGFFGPAC